MTRYVRVCLLVFLGSVLFAHEMLPQRRADSVSVLEAAHSARALTNKGHSHCQKDEKVTMCKGSKYSPQNGGCVCAFSGTCWEAI